jgi:photosystem II stability/assembly factor-like uncharacterized protein
MTEVQVTAREAEQVRQVVMEVFGCAPVALITPTVFDGEHESLAEEAKVLWWEEGPDGWAPRFTERVFTGQVAGVPPGVLLEPVNGLCLALYPKQSR